MVVGVWSGDAGTNEVSERSTGLIVPCKAFDEPGMARAWEGIMSLIFFG